MKQVILILMVIVLAATGAYWLTTNKPEIKKHTKKQNIPTIQVMPINIQDYTTIVHSSGVVEARTQTNLVAEVAGKVSLIGDAFQEGNYLNKKDLLLKISQTDYLNNIKIAKAEIAQRQLALEEQIAQGNLAKQDWDLFGEKRKKPSELAMRTPHIASAKAALEAAKIRMEQAKVQLSRTIISAPYNGRVLSRSVDIGQYVTPGTVLGKIFATDYIEVRLPLSLKEHELLDIPEHYQNQEKPKLESLPTVTFYTDKKHKKLYQWQGHIVRTSAALDSNTRQISVIARINNPFTKTAAASPLVKLGQFLQADIMGKQLSNVIVVPSS
ncbi:MAG TPA: efflux RND transporter periplasmic adaptor subunit, partial [Thiothrix sp.]|nr:efflux RND transporter periplasmic adaptor subunit [Thiothrix sp.]